MSNEDDFFSGAGSASARGANTKFADGIYPLVRVDLCKVKPGFHGLRFIVETTVMEEPRERTPGVSPTPVGATGSWGTRIDGQWGKSGIGEAKAFVAVCLGMTFEQVDALSESEAKALLHKAISPEQPHKGTLLAVECWTHTTGAGNRMLKAQWTRVGDAPAVQAPAAPPAPPSAPPAETPETAPGGPWYPIAGDPRGSHYNAQHQFRNF